ncbi:MAG: hypothetical protein ACC641_11075, partial [Acidiferrobacterales bacterium]
MTFRQLFEQLENRLGSHQIPVDAHAEGLQDLFESCPLHDDLTKQLARAIFKRNRCRHLDDPVYQDKTESVLKEIRSCVRQEKHTDIDRYNFIEDYCQAVHEFFTVGNAAEIKNSPGSPATPRSAQIINFERYRMRKLRWR